ncbi:TPA: MerR family transcriptional regulator [Enterococcus faecalis]|uniref:MerR family transcriptional regulator n=1 Tax=Enterococcus faecalis TaxID=1351 RepID=UPI001CB21291|nr:MerR family transcriptional regulator [Enterococcus faecalis]HBI3769153.1 MerR family transcriptional regulator [Enterococcus faecalis]
MNNYLTISEFAKYVNLSRRTLIYYDQIDLFKPKKISNHGFRYYTCDQCFELDVILTLKFLDIPLEQIKYFLNNRNMDDTLAEFKNRKKILDKKINDLRYMQTFLENYIDRYTTLKNIDFDTITHSYREEESFICSDLMHSHYYDSIDSLSSYSDFYLSLDKKDLFNGYPINFLVEESVLSDIQNTPFRSLIKINKDQSSLYDTKRIVTRPNGIYVSFFIEDSNYNKEEINKKLMNYFLENRFIPQKSFWKILWQDEITTNIPEKRVFEILIPVKYNQQFDPNK